MGKSGIAYFTYHPEDVECALQLATDLRNRGIPLFMDRLDISPRQNWTTTSTHALLNCAVLIVILSPAYMRSPAGRNTLQRMADLSRPIIPVMLHTLAAADYPTQVDYRQSVALQGWQADAIYTAGLTQLADTLEKTRTLKIACRLDPEMRYVNSLNMMIETYKSYLEAPLTEHDMDEQALVMPAPRMEAEWGIGATYHDLGNHTENNSLIGDLPYWAGQVRRFMLIGANGVGKTTTLMRLMSEHVHEYLRDSHHTPVPLYADLSHWNPDDSLTAFMVQQARPIGDPTADIYKGRYAVYVDGLSELGIYSEVKLHKLRDWLHDKKAPPRVVIACDDSLYTPRYGLDLPIVRMAPLNDSQRRAQITACMGRSARHFVERLAAHPPAARWEQSALLLRAVMFYTRSRPQNELPSNSERLLIQVVELLCEGEQIRNNPDWKDFHTILPRLAYFAYRVMTTGHPYSVTPEQAIEFLGSEGLLHALISARVLSVRMKRVRFWHRSLLNVFAAYHLKGLAIHEQLSYTDFDEHGRRISHFWDAPLVALAGILDDANPMLLHLSEVDPYLAVEALSGHSVREDTRQTVLERFMRYAVEHKTVGYSATLALLDTLTLNTTIPTLLDIMRSGLWSQQVAAHEFLLRLPYPIADDLTMLQSWDGEISEELATYFASIGAEVLPLLLRLLHSPNSTARRGAAWALRIVCDKAAAVGLIVALTDDDTAVRILAAQALRTMPQVAAAELLVKRLNDDDGRVRKAATGALLALGSAAVPMLRRLLQSPTAKDKRLAMGVLGRLGDPSVSDDLLPYIEHDNVDLRAISVIALGRLKEVAAVPSLGTRADDTETPRWSQYSVAQLAQQALESIGTEEAMSMIQSLFGRRSSTTTSGERGKTRLQQDRDSSPEAQTVPDVEEVVPPAPAPVSASPVALEQPLPYGDNDALDDLLNRLENTVWPQRQKVAAEIIQYAKRLHKRTDASVVRRLEGGLYHDDPFIRETMIQALGYIAHPSANHSLITLLTDHIWTIRRAAMRALSETGDLLAVAPIMLLLQDRRAEVREVAAEVLGCFQRREATPALIEVLADDSEFVRAAAIRALSNIGDEQAIAGLVDLLQQPDTDQKAMILGALGSIGTLEAVKGIVPLLNVTDRPLLSEGLSLHDLAINALETIGSPAALKILAQQRR